jgi:hypothetical protein
MKKMRFASIASICMLPMLFWSNESSAIPSWARKYNTSCYMCHSGFPQRNAVGEAFRNNGFRLPGGGDDAFTKQENIKIGTDEWKKAGVSSPNSGSFPQFDPLSFRLTGNLVSWTESAHTAASPSQLTINAPNTVGLFFGATISNTITVFGQLSGFGSGTVETDTDGTTKSTSVDTQVTANVRANYQISPGFNFAIGNQFSNVDMNGNAQGGVANVASVLPAPVTYAELNLTKGETGGYSIVAGTSMGARTTTPIVTTKNKITDLLYLRGKLKLIGAGLLSGTGGEMGNAYNGIDNQLAIGAGVVYTKNNADVKDASTGITPTTGFTGNYIGEKLVYGADINGAYNDLLVGVAASRDRDLKENNYKVDAGYYIYPWLFAKVSYTNIANLGVTTTDRRNPSIAPSIAAWIAPNISLTGTYTHLTKSKNAAGAFNNDTAILAVNAAF